MFLSGGELVLKTAPVMINDLGQTYFPSMPGMSSSNWPAATYGALYERHLWVYVVITKRARATARLPLPVYGKTPDGGRERLPDHPMAKLLDRPNPGMSGFDLWLWTAATFDIHGMAFWLKIRNGRSQVTALYPLHPTAMTLEDGRWTFNNGRAEAKRIDPDDLVIFRAYHPSSSDVGLSPLEPLRATLENEFFARQATSSFWQRGARPGMALSHPGNLSDGAQERLKRQIDADHAGARNTGSTLILEEGMEPKPMMLTQEEAQYVDTRKLNREEVCAAYDVPPPVVHILDRATFSNITEQMRSMYRDTMAPLLKQFEATIEVDLRQAEWPTQPIYAEFLMDGVLRGDFEARQSALKNADYMTIAEKRKIENLPHVPGTDRILINQATIPLDRIDDQVDAQTEPAQPQLPAQDKPPAITDGGQAAARAVAGRLSWQQSLEDVDGLLLIKELDEDHAGYVLLALHEERAAGGTVAGLRARIRTALAEEGR